MTTALPSLVAPMPGAPALPSTFSASTLALTQRQKAAVIVRLALSEESELTLTSLPQEMQQDLTMHMSVMRHIDRDTMAAVIEEFIAELESIGMSFAGGLEGALNALDGKIDPVMAERMRKEGGVRRAGDPWERITGLDANRLLPVLEEESIEVGAVMLSKLNVSKAAELLGLLPGERARRITYAVSLTGAVTPDAVRRIGQSLATQLDSIPPRAFDDGPVERVGAILNSSLAATRDDVLTGLDETDQAFATQVRAAIFTFTNIPDRIDPRDVPKIIRGLDQAVLVIALAYAASGDMGPSAEFILDNMSKRMSDGLRDEIKDTDSVKEADGEAAMSKVIAEIRTLEAAAEIYFISNDE